MNSNELINSNKLINSPKLCIFTLGWLVGNILVVVVVSFHLQAHPLLFVSLLVAFLQMCSTLQHFLNKWDLISKMGSENK